MTTRSFDELQAQAMADPKRRTRIDRYDRAIGAALALTKLRRTSGLTQRQLAAKAGVSQARVSKIERGENLHLSTLRSYVEALGYKLEIAVVHDGERLPIMSEDVPAQLPAMSSRA